MLNPASTRLLRFFLCVALLRSGSSALFADDAAAVFSPAVLRPETFKPYIDSFNANDAELYPGYVSNAAAWSFLATNMPLFECPDKGIEQTYYFRWWTFRKHIKQTPDGFIITEFLPDVPWAGKDNSIDCAAGHHFYEGRWLADPKYLNDYAVFWFRKGGEPRRYSFWAADAVWARCLVTRDTRSTVGLLPDLVANYQAWEKSNLGTNGLFWQIDDRDGMEMSAGGSGYRPTINSYMFGDAVAISNIARMAGRADLAGVYGEKAAALKNLVESQLWNSADQFFETKSRETGRLADVREECGFTPWYFNLPGGAYSVAWKQLIDPHGFFAPYGPTTVEQRFARFTVAYRGHECQWNGPSWPYATSITLTAMANLLNHHDQNFVGRNDYLALLKIYAGSQRLHRDDGNVVPWIDEVLDPHTGVWIARDLLRQRGSEIPERGKDYNHSTFCDLIITGLVGLRPRADDQVEVNPLLAAGAWDYFCLDRAPYHGHSLTILFDKSGTRYGRGRGLRVLDNGRQIAAGARLQRLNAAMSADATK